MIFRTLYSRMALTLFVLLCLVGLILIQLIGDSSALYQQDINRSGGDNGGLGLAIVKRILELTAV